MSNAVNEVDNLDQCLNDTFEWSYDWVKSFTICSKIFEDSYWNNQLLAMIQMAITNLFVYSKISDQVSTKYYFEQGVTSQVTFIKFESDEQCVNHIALKMQYAS
jgi:hypothetical protein